jgi:hypothetical protein
MQPPFTRSAWLGEVQKMKDTYGGHISDQEVPQIVDYLVFLNGKPDSGNTPANAHYGE